MADWTIIPKPAELAENRLLDAILDGTFPINSNLPPERDLAEKLGVTRPTLREALQRLSQSGWIEIHHGRPTRVKNYWEEGNLLILNALAKHPKNLPDHFVPDLLEVRIALAPVYTCSAIQQQPENVVNLLTQLQGLSDTPDAYTQADFNLHFQLTVLSGNPVYTLIFNGFGELYLTMGLNYFASPEARRHSHTFYQDLLAAAVSKNLESARQITQNVMQTSLAIWQSQAVKH